MKAYTSLDFEAGAYIRRNKKCLHKHSSQVDMRGTFCGASANLSKVYSPTVQLYICVQRPLPMKIMHMSSHMVCSRPFALTQQCWVLQICHHVHCQPKTTQRSREDEDLPAESVLGCDLLLQNASLLHTFIQERTPPTTWCVDHS